MAGITCGFCEENTALMLATILETGDVTGVCGPCMPVYALGIAAEVTRDMPAELAEAMGAQLDQIAANDSRPKSKRKRPVTSGQAHDPGTDGVVAGTAADDAATGSQPPAETGDDRTPGEEIRDALVASLTPDQGAGA